LLIFSTDFIMGVCDSSIYSINHQPNTHITRVKVLPSARVLVQSEAENNVSFNNEQRYYDDQNNFDSGAPVPVSNLPLDVLGYDTDYKSYEPVDDSNRQVFNRQQENQEVVPFREKKQWQLLEHHIPELGSDHWENNPYSPRLQQARTQNGEPSQLQSYRRLSSAFFECEEQKGDDHNRSMTILPELKIVAPKGFSKKAFHEFVENIPGPDSHRAVVLAQFEQLWTMLSEGSDQIPLSKLDAFYNTQKIKEEHSMGKLDCETVKTDNGNYRSHSNGKSDVRQIVIQTGNEQYCSEGSDSEGSTEEWQCIKKIQTSTNHMDGYQHQLSLEELDQTQSEDDLNIMKRFSLESSSTKSLSYKSVTPKAQTVKEYKNPQIDDLASRKIFKAPVVSESPLLSCSVSNDLERDFELFPPPNTPVGKQILYQGLPVTQKQSRKACESSDETRCSDFIPEVCKDFIFLPGPRIAKRKRVIQWNNSSTNRAGLGLGYWEDFEDLNRVSNPERRSGWRQRRQRTQNLLKEHRKSTKDSRYREGLKQVRQVRFTPERLNSVCMKFGLSPSIGEDIIASHNSGEILSTVDLLNRYGDAAALKSLKQFNTWCYTSARKEISPRSPFI